MHTIVWDDQAQARAAWGWLPARLASSWTVGGEIPSGYESYVSVPNSLDPRDNGCSLVGPATGPDQLARLLDVVRPATGDQPVHCAIWEGFGGMFREAGGTITGAALLTAIKLGASRAARQAARLERERLEREWIASRPPRPAATTLQLPGRGYYTWSTTLDRVRADAELLDGFSPTILAPADRSWLWHSEIDGRRTEVGGSAQLLAPLVGPPCGGIVVEWTTPLEDVPGWPSWSEQ